MFLVSDCYKAEIVDLQHSDVESLWCRIQLRSYSWSKDNINGLLVGVLYRPPKSDHRRDQELFELMRKSDSVKCTHKLIVGDFNFPTIDWDNFQFQPCCDDFIDTILDLNLSQHVLKPTRNEAILALIFSSDSNLVSNVDIIEPLGMSDHNMVFCELNWSQTNSVNGPSSMKHHSFQNADWELFSELIIKIDYEKIFEHESVDDIWNAFAKALSEVVDLSIPVKNQAKKRRAAPIWETKEVTVARKARNKAERVYLSNKTHANKENRNKTSKQLKAGCQY